MADGGVLRAGIGIRPIAEADIKEGEEQDGLLLYPDQDEQWTIGGWHGDEWYDAAGRVIKPLLWALLPTGATLAAWLAG